jgi:hypothetical protein
MIADIFSRSKNSSLRLGYVSDYKKVRQLKKQYVFKTLQAVSK